MKGTRQESYILYLGLLGVGLLCGLLTGTKIVAPREDRLTAAGSEDCQAPEAPQVRAALTRPGCSARTL